MRLHHLGLLRELLYSQKKHRFTTVRIILDSKRDHSPKRFPDLHLDPSATHAPQTHTDQRNHHIDSQAQQSQDPDYIQTLRTAHDTMRRQLENSDVPIDDVFVAQDLVAAMGGLLTEHLRRRVKGDLEAERKTS